MRKANKTPGHQGVVGPREEARVEPRRDEQLLDLLATEAERWAIFELDPGGRVTGWNMGAERLTGYKAQDILGKQFSVLVLPGAGEQAEPAEELTKAAACGRCETEGLAVRQDGSVFLARRVSIALRGGAESLCGFAQVLHDLTPSKVGETALELCIELWDQLAEGLLVFGVEDSSSGRSLRVIGANAAVLQLMRGGGPGLEELSGAKWSDVSQAFRPLLNEELSNAIWSVIDSGQAKDLGVSRRRDNVLRKSAFALKAFPLPCHCAGLLFEKIPESGRTVDASE